MKDLARSMKGRPFSILGINTDDEDRSILHQRAKKQELIWPIIYDGPPKASPNSRRWNVSSYPTLIVIDANEIIRFRGNKLEDARAAVETLVKELERSQGR